LNPSCTPLLLRGRRGNLLYRHEVTPSVVPIAVRMAIRVWRMNFHVSFFFMIVLDLS